MARKTRPHRNNHGVTAPMARVIVHEIFPFKLKNGSVQVREPKAEYQVVKREIAEALVACGRGVLDETDLQFVRHKSD